MLEKLEQSNVEQFEENDKNYNEKLKSIGFDINDYLPDCAFRYKKAVERYNKEKEKRDRAEAERRAEIRRREEAKEAAKKNN